MTFLPGSSSDDIPPPWYPFVPPFDPPFDTSGSPSPPTPLHPPEGSSSDDDTSVGERPDWWPDDVPWPPQPEEPVVIESPPPLPAIIWPRLPPDHPYHVPPGHSYPDNLPDGHPGHYYPEMPPYPVVHPGGAGDG